MCLLRENYRFLNNFAYNFSSNWSHFDVCAKFEGDQNNNEILQCIWHRFNHDIGSVIDFIFFSSGIVWNGRDVIWETLSTCKLFYFSVLSWQIIIIGICIFNDKYSPTLISFEMFVLYLELWSSKDSGEMIKDQQHHRLQQTFQIILLPPCTQPPPPLPASSSSIHLFLVEPHYPCYLRLPLWSGRGLVTSHSLLCQLAGGGENEGGRRRNTSGGFPTHGRPGQLSSDSLFCNCPHGLLSSLERR